MNTAFLLPYAMSVTACFLCGVLWPYRTSTVPAYTFCVSLMLAAAFTADSVGGDVWLGFAGKLSVAAHMFAKCGALSFAALIAGMLLRRLVRRGGRSLTLDRSYESRSRRQLDIRA
jgi:hypothetical protein